MRARFCVGIGVSLSLLALATACHRGNDGGESKQKAEVPAGSVTPGAPASRADNREREADCKVLPTPEQLRQMLIEAPQSGGDAGGLWGGRKSWAATVNFLEAAKSSRPRVMESARWMASRISWTTIVRFSSPPPIFFPM